MNAIIAVDFYLWIHLCTCILCLFWSVKVSGQQTQGAWSDPLSACALLTNKSIIRSNWLRFSSLSVSSQTYVYSVDHWHSYILQNCDTNPCYYAMKFKYCWLKNSTLCSVINFYIELRFTGISSVLKQEPSETPTNHLNSCHTKITHNP